MTQTDLYALYPTSDLRSSLTFRTHLPYADVVAAQHPIGAPEWRAVRRAARQPDIAGPFAAHAHAYARSAASGHPDQVRHLGALHGLALAVIAADTHPTPITEYTSRATRALYEAATGDPFPGPDAFPVVRTATGR